MDYEQKYKAALEWMQGMYGGLHGKTKEEAEKYFPELSESEDEKIRKWIIDDIRYNMNNEPLNNSEYKKEAEKAIAWLEKQGKEDSSIQQAYKQGYIEGQRIERKCWLEKQVEKPQDKTALEVAKEEKSPAESLGISPEKYEEIVNECIYGEEKSVNEPKFHVGDWVVNKFGDSWHIDSFNKENYQVSNGKGNFNWFPIAKQDEMRFWTIEDAKDGDVICYKDEISLYKGEISLYRKDIKPETSFGGFVYHYCYDGKRFITDSFYSLTEQDKTDIHPATKEQRDTLMKAMADAGWEFDFDKKELRKIDTLLDLLQKMPSCITVDGIDYHFVMKKTIFYKAYYEGEGEEGKGKVIFMVTAYSPIDLLTEMLEKLKKEGLLE